MSNNGHWDKFGTSRAHMRIVDYSGSAWPVVSAFNTWNANPNIYMGYMTNPASCSSHCINTAGISPANDPEGLMGYNCTGVVGYFTGWMVGGRNHFTEQVKLRFNNSCNSALNANQRLKITCHEIGHSLGLGHTGATDTCMKTNALQGSNSPSSHDYSEIHNAIYNHPDST